MFCNEMLKRITHQSCACTEKRADRFAHVVVAGWSVGRSVYCRTHDFGLRLIPAFKRVPESNVTGLERCRQNPWQNVRISCFAPHRKLNQVPLCGSLCEVVFIGLYLDLEHVLLRLDVRYDHSSNQ